MEKIAKELRILINKELYNKNLIGFDEFKLMNEKLMGEKSDIASARREIFNGKTIYDMELNVGYYARVSTDKDDQVNSIENQSNYFKDMIKENNNWTLVGEYIDEGISGTSIKNRENFLKMLEDSKKGIIDLIVTKEISRFSRNVIDSIKYTEELLRNGTIVYFLSDDINTIYPDSEFRLSLMSSLAQDEVRKLSERVKFGIKRMIKDGKVIGGSLTGYYKKDGKMIVNEIEKPIIEILFNLYVTGKYSFERISKILYNKGYKNKKGKPYLGTTLKKILTNPRYKGYYTANMSRIESYKNHKRINLPSTEHIIYKTNLIEPIIPEEIWNKANEIYNHKCKLIDKYVDKIFCADHDKPFVRDKVNSRRSNPIWICKEYKENGVIKCNSPIIREKMLDKTVIDIIYKHMTEDVDVNTKKIINEYRKILYECQNTSKIKEKNELNKYMIEKEKLIEFSLKGIISNKEMQTRLLKKESEIKRSMKEFNQYKIDGTYNKRLKEMEREVDNFFCVENNLNAYINLFIDKIKVIKGRTRYEMNLEIYFNDGNMKNVYYEN